MTFSLIGRACRECYLRRLMKRLQVVGLPM